MIWFVVWSAYLKEAERLDGASRQRDAWLLIAAGISAIILLLVVISLFVFEFSRHKRKQRRVEGSANRSRVFEREQTDKGEDNMAFHEDDSHSRVMITLRTLFNIRVHFNH